MNTLGFLLPLYPETCKCFIQICNKTNPFTDLDGNSSAQRALRKEFPTTNKSTDVDKPTAMKNELDNPDETKGTVEESAADSNKIKENESDRTKDSDSAVLQENSNNIKEKDTTIIVTEKYVVPTTLKVEFKAIEIEVSKFKKVYFIT